MKAFLKYEKARRSAGAALVIALAFLILLSVVVLALFSTTSTDRQNSNAFATGQETLRLADATVSLVQGQIRDATTQPRVSWASQPGMVRAFDTAGNTTAYKLYSSEQLVVPGFGGDQIKAEFEAMQKWNDGAPANSSFNALYADLNAPAVVKRRDPGDPDKTVSTPVFPIADPAAIGAVEGFDATTDVAGTVLGTAGDATRRLPMPVRWLYVLRDGQMTAATGGDAKKATFSGAVVPSKANPIVGRIAFWTDDDTSKLNINTASEGTFWDVPKANTQSEVRLGIAVPVKGEFQRLVGHPATTSLSPVLKNLLPRDPDIFLADYLTDIKPKIVIKADAGDTFDPYFENLTNYWSLTPRIHHETSQGQLGSSMAGLYRTSYLRNTDVQPNIWPEGEGAAKIWDDQGFPVIHDNDRLYATTDELAFSPERKQNHPNLSSSELSKRDFFLTAHSRAPETTLFGTPRISLWPQQTNLAEHRNAIDRLIAICSTVADQEYFFQRSIADGLETSVPPADQTEVDSSLPVNTKLFTYLRNILGTRIPGFGAITFATKWGDTTGLDKVIAQTFDYARSNINDQVADFAGETYSYSVYPKTNPKLYSTGGSTGGGPQRYVVPAKISNNARGFGRFFTISEAAIVFMATEVENLPADLTSPVTNQITKKMRGVLVFQPFYPVPGSPEHFPGAKIKISGSSGLSTSLGNMPFYGDENIFGTRQNDTYGAGTDRCFGTFQYLFTYDNNGNQAIKTLGGNPVTQYPFATGVVNVPNGVTDFVFNGGAVIVEIRAFKSDDLIQTLTFDFPSVTLPVPQHVRCTDLGTAIDNVQGGLFDRNMKDLNSLSLDNRMSLNGRGGRGTFITNFIAPGDVVLGVGLDPDPAGPSKGDYRLLALQENVPAPWFKKHPLYTEPKLRYQVGPDGKVINFEDAVRNRFAASLRNEFTKALPRRIAGNASSGLTILNFGWRAAFRGGKWFFSENETIDTVRPRIGGDNPNIDPSPHQGTLHSSISFAAHAAPVVPYGTTGVLNDLNRPGDWTSGSGNYKDGGFFSRSDGGTSKGNLGGYFGLDPQEETHKIKEADFEPNRFVPSSGVLATIVTPDATGELAPWQTLLTNPFPAAGSGSANHRGFSAPADHLFLDNFWMPVSEPYPISEPLATAGKVNLNTQLLPFTQITRTTALRGALVPVFLGAVPNSAPSEGGTNEVGNYKYAKPGTAGPTQIRHRINSDQTMAALTERFDDGDIYRSGTEVCTIPLVPEGTTKDNVASWWDGYKPTSDTLREQPYTALLSRVTTKSNTFTVHYWVQAVRQGPRVGRDWAEFVEGSDPVVGEYRGSTSIERFLDTNAENIPDYRQATLSGEYVPIDKFYRWRVISQKQFAQ